MVDQDAVMSGQVGITRFDSMKITGFTWTLSFSAISLRNDCHTSYQGKIATFLSVNLNK